MDRTVKIYHTTRNRVQADGTIISIPVTCKYSVKPPALNQEQIAEIQGLLAMGVPKKKLCAKYNVSLFVLNKALAPKSAE